MLNTWHLLCLVVLHTRNIPQIHSYTSINRWYVWRTFTYTLSIYTINNNSTSFFFSIPLVSHFTQWSIISLFNSTLTKYTNRNEISSFISFLDYVNDETIVLSSQYRHNITKKSSIPSMHSFLLMKRPPFSFHTIHHPIQAHVSLILKKRYDTKHCLTRKLILARRTQGRRQIYLSFLNFIPVHSRVQTRENTVYTPLYDNRNHTDKQNISSCTRSTIFHLQQILPCFE